MNTNTIQPGTRVRSQGAVIVHGTVSSYPHPLPQFLYVMWDDDDKDSEEFCLDVTVDQ